MLYLLPLDQFIEIGFFECWFGLLCNRTRVPLSRLLLLEFQVH
jgi:hypothetical protein